eukprot:364150-Chlamydomonas_euryale.AAC.7
MPGLIPSVPCQGSFHRFHARASGEVPYRAGSMPCAVPCATSAAPQLPSSHAAPPKLCSFHVASTKMGSSHAAVPQLPSSHAAPSKLGSSHVASTKMGSSYAPARQLARSHAACPNLGSSRAASSRLASSRSVCGAGMHTFHAWQCAQVSWLLTYFWCLLASPHGVVLAGELFAECPLPTDGTPLTTVRACASSTYEHVCFEP